MKTEIHPANDYEKELAAILAVAGGHLWFGIKNE
jgi:hypothetical protein